MTLFLLFASGLAGGAVAAVAGFGIGSLLTPAFSATIDTRLAIAAVALPHLVGTTQRFWRLRTHVDGPLLVKFGVPSAIGGLAGASLLPSMTSHAATLTFAALLIFVAAGEWTGRLDRLRFHGWTTYAAGGLSGLLGGLVGNQGGIRSAALLGFDISKERFVATLTAVGLVVDAARVPIYLAREHDRLLALWPAIAVATIGVVIGTAAGGPILRRIPQASFRRLIAATLAILGLGMLTRLG